MNPLQDFSNYPSDIFKTLILTGESFFASDIKYTYVHILSLSPRSASVIKDARIIAEGCKVVLTRELAFFS